MMNHLVVNLVFTQDSYFYKPCITMAFLAFAIFLEFKTLEFAYMLDSLVRVTRRV